MNQKECMTLESMKNYASAGHVPLLKSDLLGADPRIAHGFTTRLGGVSQDHLSSLNLSFTRGDDPDKVMENYRRLAAELDGNVDQIVTTDQTHTKTVRVVTKEDAGKGIVRERDYSDVDGLVTNVPGLILSVFVADCVPVLLYDPVHRAIGAVHSGWRGTVGRISKVALDLMQENYGTNPEDVRVAIGPSICRDCYEVSQDVAEEFMKEFQVEAIPYTNHGRVFMDDKTGDKTGDKQELEHAYERLESTDRRTSILPDPGYGSLLYKKENGHYQLDLWAAIRKSLLEAGVYDEHIDILGVCTMENSEWLFSHRATAGKRGNMAGVISLKDKKRSNYRR